MRRKNKRKGIQHTAPDHRPMIPEFRHPDDMLDAAIREVRRRYDDINPNEQHQWR